MAARYEAGVAMKAEDKEKYLVDLGKASGLRVAIDIAKDHNCSHEGCQCWKEIEHELKKRLRELT